MLALLSRAATQLLDVRLEGSISLSEDEEAFSVDINALSAGLPDLPWRRIAQVYANSISPMYKSIQNILVEDVDRVVQLLSELGPVEGQDHQNDGTDTTIHLTNLQHPFPLNTRREYLLTSDTTLLPNYYLKRLPLYNPTDHPILIPSTHPCTPSILITPCAPSSCSSLSRVPLQDASYGNKLAVPGYPHLNSHFVPPMLKPGHAPLVERWKWRDGHWWAVVPDLEMQGRKGWFSRPLSTRRRASRSCRSGLAAVDFQDPRLRRI